MPKRKIVTPVKVRRNKLKRVKRRLFVKTAPTHVVGDSYLPTKYGVSGKANKRLSFSQRVAKAEFPPFTYQEHFVSGIDHNDSNKQNIHRISLFNMDKAEDTLTKLRDIYSNNYGTATSNLGAVSDALPPVGSMPISNPVQYQGIRTRLLSNLFSFTFINTCSATCELEFLLVRPTKNIPKNDTVHDDPVQWWTNCNNRAAMTGGASIPFLTNTGASATVSNLTVGDRPYKGPAAYFYKKWWNVVRKDKVVLQPGQLFKWVHTQNINGILDYDDQATYKNMALWGLELIVIGKGQVVNGTANAGFSDVSYSDFQVSYTFNQWTKARLEKFVRPVKYYQGTDGVDLAGNQQQVFNPDSRTTVQYHESY